MVVAVAFVVMIVVAVVVVVVAVVVVVVAVVVGVAAGYVDAAVKCAVEPERVDEVLEVRTAETHRICLKWLDYRLR